MGLIDLLAIEFDDVDNRKRIAIQSKVA